MSPDRWNEVTRLFGEALERRVEDRESFVRARAADAALADEVLSLLASHDRAGDFLEDAAADVPGPDSGLLPAGAEVGHYRIAGLLGTGGMGVVYLARDTRLNRDVALKAVAPSFAGDPVRVARLRQEARAAAALSHPNIAVVHALEEIDGRLYIASEYVPGETLRDELRRGRLPSARVRDDGQTLARALAAAHDRGVVHRDLKPENVVRGIDGRLRILDFGLAQVAAGSHETQVETRTGGALGTPGYMSPEQIRGAAIDGRSDLFALGVLLYELGTGVHPFAADTPAATLARVLEDEPPPLAPGAAPLDRVVGRLLAKDPRDRYADGREVAAALEAGAADAAPAPPAQESGTPAIWWWQFHQGAAIVTTALLVWPLWHLRHAAPGPAGMTAFLVALVAAVISGALRLHDWFGARQFHQAWKVGRKRTRAGIVAADVVFGVVLILSGLRAFGTNDLAASLLVAAGVGVLVTVLVVEPATTRAALGPGGRER